MVPPILIEITRHSRWLSFDIKTDFAAIYVGMQDADAVKAIKEELLRAIERMNEFLTAQEGKT